MIKPQYITVDEAERLMEVASMLTLHTMEWSWTGSAIVRNTFSNDIDIAVYDPKEIIYKKVDKSEWRSDGSTVAFDPKQDKFISFKRYASAENDKYSPPEEVKLFTGEIPRIPELKLVGERPINLILTTKAEEYKYYRDATEILYEAQLKDKNHRVELFQYMRNEIEMDPERFAMLASGDVSNLKDKDVRFASVPF